LKHLKTLGLVSLDDELKWFMAGLRKIWSIFLKGGTKMKMNFTPEEVTKFGKEFGDIWLAGLTPQERLAGLKPQQWLTGLKPSEQKEILSGFKPQERVAGLKPQERLAGLKPKELEEIENYLKQSKRRKR
jgi:hypothetical protein